MVGITHKKGRGGGVPVHCAALRCRCCPHRCPARYPAQPVITRSLWSWVVMVVVAGLWVVVVVVVVVGWVVLNEPNVGSSLGDMAHHVIQVGTCCSNWHDST